MLHLPVSWSILSHLHREEGWKRLIWKRGSLHIEAHIMPLRTCVPGDTYTPHTLGRECIHDAGEALDPG